MLRTTALPVAVLLGLTLLHPTSATAVGETCQGQPATHVGSPDVYELQGTEGNDVIVTNGAQSVKGLGGDDLICVTSTGHPWVYAGTGNDIVDATLATGGTITILGEGTDTFVGSSAIDNVAGGIDFYRADAERDVIDTGAAGANEDQVWSGNEDATNSDEVRMGWGRLSWNGSATSESLVDGGAGSLIDFGTTETLHLTIDNVAGTLQQRRRPTLEIPGFTRFLVGQPKGLEGFIFRGSNRDELLSMSYDKRPAGSKVNLGAGDDELSFSAWRESRKSTYTGGRGDDLISLRMSVTDDLDLDLNRGTLATGSGSKEVTVPARSFENAKIKARDIEIVGTNGDNDIELHGCRARVSAGGGEDDVSTFVQGPDAGPIICRERRLTFLGGSGNDTLTGNNGPDRLIGGPGRDTADGREGRDVCEAEKKTSCEVRG